MRRLRVRCAGGHALGDRAVRTHPHEGELGRGADCCASGARERAHAELGCERGLLSRRAAPLVPIKEVGIYAQPSAPVGDLAEPCSAQTGVDSLKASARIDRHRRVRRATILGHLHLYPDHVQRVAEEGSADPAGSTESCAFGQTDRAGFLGCKGARAEAAAERARVCDGRDGRGKGSHV